ncbi:MAG: NAD(P)/FAD-dependent oxidoreductase [Panacagrimonas sp.]
MPERIEVKGTAPIPDVLVVGAGVIGLATAWELLCRGLKVSVIERGRIGPGGASWAGGGILAPLEPAELDADLEPLLRDSLASYADWCTQLKEDGGVDPEYTVSGLAVLEPADEPAWRVWAQGCALRIDPGRPQNNFGGKRASVFELPGIAQVRSPRLLRTLAAAVRARGGDIIEDEAVVALEESGLRTTRRRLHAGCVVLAAGAWSGELDAAAEVAPVKGEMLLFEAAGERLERILLHHDMYLIPRRDGRIVAGSTLERAGFDAMPSVAGRERILTALRQFAPQLARREPMAHWAGLRPAPLMGVLPKMQWSDGHPKRLLNCGHYRLGISLAPGSARRIARLLLDGMGS